MEYKTIKSIVDQLEKCGFFDEHGHRLENNKAFIALREKIECDRCEANTAEYLCGGCLERSDTTSPNS